MKLNKTILTIACALIPMGAVHAISYSGEITVSNGLLSVGGSWANANGGLSWIVDDISNPGYWTYKYSFNLPGTSPDISHAIVEVTDGATDREFRVTGGADSEVGQYESGQPGNPGLLGSIFGIKVNTPGNTVEPWEWSIVTLRNPVWQDFYAKGGNNGYAHNFGFLAADPTSAPSNGSIGGHILGPNGGTDVPDGGATLTLMGLALSGLAAGRRFLKKA